MDGQVYFCHICFTKLNFSLIIKLDLALTYFFFGQVACHVIVASKFNKSVNWLRIFSLLISKWAFSMQIEIVYLATSRMLFLDYFVFRRYKWSKVEFWKAGRSFQTWEEENNCPASKTRFFQEPLQIFQIIAFFPLNVTWYVTWPVRSTNSTLKCSGR